MRFQSNQSSCGPAAIRNALLCLGIQRSEDELTELAGTSPSEGTTDKGILRALKAISKEHTKVSPAVISEAKPDVALLRLLESLRAGHPVIVCTDGGEHWAVAFGLLGMAGGDMRIHVSDSGDIELVLHHTPQDFLATWRGKGKRPYYGIVV